MAIARLADPTERFRINGACNGYRVGAGSPQAYFTVCSLRLEGPRRLSA